MEIIAIVICSLFIGKAIRKAQQRRCTRSAQVGTFSSPALYVPSAALRAEQRAIEQKQKEEKRRAVEAKKAREKAEKAKVEKDLASSDLEFIHHRLDQIYRLIEIAEENQSGTIYGGKEWMKLEKQIMTYEGQAQALKKRERKARATKNRAF